MAKAKKSVYFCQNCGHEESKWLGQCPMCKEWNTFAEEKVVSIKGQKSSGEKQVQAVTLSSVTTDEDERMKTELVELDRVLGGGIVPGSLVLVGGDPGIGKSTLLLQVCQKLSAMNKIQGWNYTLATCGEKINIKKYGIEHNRCIDGDLITELAWNDSKLMNFMKVKIETIPSPTFFANAEIPKEAIILPQNHYFISAHKKDPGQREYCECMAAKDIGEYNTCPHLCEYCYANANKKIALINYKSHLSNSDSDTISGKY